ncbi:Receptor protein kinase [Melia azedarach]|uniref:Receptor protein kinase n=1 Tax=Melia azedarach TaxID=155640 RepID=A0ACC1WWB6_MELAZ|nr:Receptor protein kinase [Melia azedarach]
MKEMHSEYIGISLREWHTMSKTVHEHLNFMACKKALSISALLVTVNLFNQLNAIDTVSQSQFLSDSQNESLVSSDGNFRLGFFSPGKSQFRYVGIWFNKVPKQTVVWVANRETPIKNSAGTFKIGGDGNLAGFDGNKNGQLWSTNVSIRRIPQLWQSFDYPTDTLLPGMKFGLNRKIGLNHIITSWRSSVGPAPGEFSVRLDPSGSPQFFLYKSTGPSWRGGPWNGRNLNGIPDVATKLRSHNVDYSNQVDIINYTFVNNDNEAYIKFSSRNGTIFSRIVLEPTGTVQRLIWHENKTWEKFWMAPEDLCDEYARCDVNAICNEDTVVHCSCLPGFEPLYPQNWKRKCVEQRKVDGCGKGAGEGFVRLEDVKLPDASISKVYDDISLKECERECLKSCNCTGYAIADVTENGRGCITWYGELKDMRQYKDGQDFYPRVDAVEQAAHALKNSKEFPANRSMIAVIIVPVVLEVLVIAACFYYFCRSSRERKGQKKKQRRSNMLRLESAISSESGDRELKMFDLSTMIAATDNFSSDMKLGRGGFGPVYKGRLPNGQEIAIKRLSENSRQGFEEFKNEVLLIAKLQHKNLVRLLGCCLDEDEKMLIYEFMPNKSLDYFIFDESRKLLLDWKKRHDIILVIARGILYLHQDSRFTIIHRDLKASNILLDGEMKPKISDFGTARIFCGDQTQENTNKVVGTFGYMSPEYVLGGIFSMKSDVFSFGVLILEVISGKKNASFFPDDPSSNLIKYTWELWRDDKALEIVDSSIADSCPADEVLRCIEVGLLCVQDDGNDRPTMSTAVFMLSNETPLPSPKQPEFVIRRAWDKPDSYIMRTRSSINEVTVTTFTARRICWVAP